MGNGERNEGTDGNTGMMVMRGIRVAMRGNRVGMRGIRMGMRGIRVKCEESGWDWKETG